jgi:hypothetical protein
MTAGTMSTDTLSFLATDQPETKTKRGAKAKKRKATADGPKAVAEIEAASDVMGAEEEASEEEASEAMEEENEGVGTETEEQSFATMFESMTGRKAPLHIRIFRQYKIPLALAWEPCRTCGKHHKVGSCKLRLWKEVREGNLAAEVELAGGDCTLEEAKEQLLKAMIQHQETWTKEAQNQVRIHASCKPFHSRQCPHIHSSHVPFLLPLLHSQLGQRTRAQRKAQVKGRLPAVSDIFSFPPGTHGFTVSCSTNNTRFAGRCYPIHKLYLTRFSEALASLIEDTSISVAYDTCRVSGQSTAKLTISPAALPGPLQLIKQEAAAEAAAREAAWKHAWATLRPKILDLLRNPRVHEVGQQPSYLGAKGKGEDCFRLGGYANGYKLNLMLEGRLRPFVMPMEKILKLCTEMGWLTEFEGDEYAATKGPPLFWRVFLELTRSGEVVPVDAQSFEPLGTREEVLAEMEPYVQQEQAAGGEIGGYELFGVGGKKGGWKKSLKMVSVTVSREVQEEYDQRMHAAEAALRGCMVRQVERLVADAEAAAAKMEQQEVQLRLQLAQQEQLALSKGQGLGAAQLRQRVHDLLIGGMPMGDIVAAVGDATLIQGYSSSVFQGWLNSTNKLPSHLAKRTAQIEEAVRTWVERGCAKLESVEERVEKVEMTFALAEDGPLGMSINDCRVTGVKGQAERLGIQVGDRFLKINGTDASTTMEVHTLYCTLFTLYPHTHCLHDATGTYTAHYSLYTHYTHCLHDATGARRAAKSNVPPG